MTLRRWPITLQIIALARAGIASGFAQPIAHRSLGLGSARSASTLQGGYTSDIDTNNFWNRETSRGSEWSGRVKKEARILSLSDPGDDNNDSLHRGELPEGARFLAIGSTFEDFNVDDLRKEDPNVIFVSHPLAREPLAQLLEAFPSIEWVHSRAAGIDFITSEGLASSNVIVTNAKGMFSSTLAEYAMMACSYFAKDIPRLMRQKRAKEWEKYCVEEIRGKTLGVVGYGDIGRATAKLAKAYGMRVVALRRKPKLSIFDPYCDEVVGEDGLNGLMAQSDYVLVAAPLTEQTMGMVGAEALSCARQSAVIINVGRGPIIDEERMIEALEKGNIKGAALDVMTVEPLPRDSRLWSLDNVLLSPHNMDMTDTFMQESTEMFVQENIPRFVRGLDLLNPVDKAAGY